MREWVLGKNFLQNRPEIGICPGRRGIPIFTIQIDRALVHIDNVYPSIRQTLAYRTYAPPLWPNRFACQRQASSRVCSLIGTRSGSP